MRMATRFQSSRLPVSRIRPVQVALVSATCVLGLALAAPPGLAQRTGDVTIGIVLQPVSSKTCGQLQALGCSDEGAVITGNLEEYYALVCAFGGDPETGIAGLEFGIDYDGAAQSGVDIQSWTLCADLEIGRESNFPDAGYGNVVTWDGQGNCQKNVPGDSADGVTAIAGFFWLTAYGSDQLSIIPRSKESMSGPKFKVAECDPPAEYELDPATQAGSVGFSSDGSEKGKLPCLQHQEEDSTWGRIKSLYGN